MMPSLRRQQGIAIIMAVAIAALVAAIATFMAFRQNLWIRQVENQHDLAQARTVALAAVDLSRLTLQDDARQNQTSNATQAWNIPIPNLPVEQGNAGGQILDVQGRFNINNLVNNGGLISEPDLESFKRLLTAMGMSAELAPAVVDWIDAGSESRLPGGAKDQYYLALDPPRRAANRPMFDVAELAMVKGFDADSAKRLAPYLIALPQHTTVNVNFAPPEVLVAMIPGLDSAAAQAIAKRAKTQPFASLDDFRKLLPGSLGDHVQSDYMGVETHYFFSDVDARFGRVTVSYRALLERNGAALPRVVWLRRR